MAGPMIVSNISTPLLGAVDTAVMGHQNQAHYLGAVALGGLIFSFLSWGFGFLRMGTTGLAAQALGEVDDEEVRALLARALLLSLGLAGLVLLLQSPIAALGFRLLEGSAESEAAAHAYFAVRIWSIPATLADYVLVGWFLGLQNPRAPLAMVLVINLSNIALDLLFVVGWGWGVEGAALASVLAECGGFFTGLLLVRRDLARRPGAWRPAAIVDRRKISRLFSVNRNIFIRTLCLLFAFAFFTAQGARFGDTVLAANAVLMNFQTFMAYALDGFAHAAEALVGRAVGARDRTMFRDVMRTAGVWSGLVAVLFSVTYLVAGPQIIDTLTDLAQVRETAYRFLPWVVVLPLVSCWCYLFDGVFIGATRSPEMRDTMVFSTCLVFLPAWYALTPYGNHGLWLAFSLFMAARGISMGWVYLRIERKRGFAAGTA